MNQQVENWFDAHRPEILRHYCRVVDQGEFPSYAALPSGQRMKVFEREVDGLAAFASGNVERLRQIELTHSDQAQSITSGIPLQEALDFLSRKMEIVTGMIHADTSTEPFRKSLMRLLQQAGSYYRVKLRTFEVQRQVEGGL